MPRHCHAGANVQTLPCWKCWICWIWRICVSTQPGPLGILLPREEYAEYAKYSFQYAYPFYSAYVLTYDAQNKALVDTLCLKKSNTTQGHICLSSTSDWAYKHQGVMHISSWPFVPKKLQLSNCQDYVFILLPGMSDGAFQLRIHNTCSASCFFFSQLIQWPTLEWKHTIVHKFQGWRNTKVAGDQVILCMFAIFCILCIYCIFFLWFYLVIAQLGWMCASPP